MKKIVTGDNTFTLYNEVFDEHYHSLTGAREEAQEKYSRALRVWEKIDSVIYDVCFGLGYNSAAAIDDIRNYNPESIIFIYCFENDESVLKEILNLNNDFQCFPEIKIFIKGFLEEKKLVYESNNLRLEMFFGDVKQNILKPEKNGDFVFFDPFSPKKQPDLWSEDFFKKIRKKMNKDAKLATYSCARIPRENMKKAGFEVTDGPIVRRWSPGTICINSQNQE
mgnify:CR=1 FL=1